MSGRGSLSGPTGMDRPGVPMPWGSTAGSGAPGVAHGGDGKASRGWWRTMDHHRALIKAALHRERAHWFEVFVRHYTGGHSVTMAQVTEAEVDAVLEAYAAQLAAE